MSYRGLGLPGDRLSRKPDPGDTCDDCGSAATVIMRGETDSFGSEYLLLCDACAGKTTGDMDYHCDSCKKLSPCKPTRDPDEGSSGPVYYYCKECMRKSDSRED
jgi:hypothetical protein